MKQFLILVFALGLSFNQVAQAQDQTIIRIEDWEIPLSEFLAVYNKNSGSESDQIDPAAVKDYLDLYLNFKLKVYEAKQMGLDTNPEFLRELQGYRNQLAKPYLTDKDVTEQLIREAYERMQTEIRAQHILIRLPEDATPRDTLGAFNKALGIRKAIVNGTQTFTEAALEHSEDPSVRKNDGDLGYFSALYMVYPFENAAYRLEVGEISQPVRTRFGYHILKVNDKRPAQGEVLVAHIMIRPEKKDDKVADAAARDKAQEIYTKIQEGADFKEMVRAYSEDRGSLPKDGELPWFGTNVMVESFENAAFALEIGEVSEPVKTEFGYHIIKLLDRKGLGTFDEMKYGLKQKIDKDSRSSLSRSILVQAIKDEYGFKAYGARVKALANILDDTYYKGTWTVDKANGLDKIIFSLGDSSYTQRDLAEYLFIQQVRTGKRTPFEVIVQRAYANFEEEKVIAYENARLENKYPRFKNLMREYHEGILLFEISDQKVWTKAAVDTSGLQAYYQEIKGDFMWPERVDAVVVTCQDAKNAKKARKYLRKGKSLEWINAKLNQDSQLNFSYEQGLYAKEANAFVDRSGWELGVSEVFQDGDRFKLVYVREKLEPSPKSLKEIRGIVISEYQAVLEKQWVEDLRSTYTWEVYPELIDEL